MRRRVPLRRSRCAKRALGLALCTLVGSATASGCTKDAAVAAPEGRAAPIVTGAAPPKARIPSLIERLQSEDPATRDLARGEILGGRSTSLRFTTAEGFELLEATRLDFPEGPADQPDTSTLLVRLVPHDPAYLQRIVELHPGWSGSARQEGWKLLAGIDAPAATETFLNLLEHYGDDAAPETLPLLRLRHPERIFPRLLGFTRFEALTSGIHQVALRFCEADLLTPPLRAEQIEPLLAAYRRERDWLRGQVPGKGRAWMWDGDYPAHQTRASTLLSLFACSDVEAIEKDLREATRERDPMLVLSATASLLRHGRKVPANVLRTLATDPLTHGALYRLMKRTGTLDRFPEHALTSRAFAEAWLVRMLVSPSGLGRFPDQLALEAVRPMWSRSPEDELYVFRFRTRAPHWAAKYGWLSAVVGPYTRNERPEAEHGVGGPFVTFGDPREGSSLDDAHIAHSPMSTRRLRSLTTLRERASSQAPGD